MELLVRENGVVRDAKFEDIAEVMEKRVAGVKITPQLAKEYFIGTLSGLPKERFCALFLNNSGRRIGEPLLLDGTIDLCIATPRDIAKAAILRDATVVVCAHNHPSGNTRPSIADKELTQVLQLGLKLFDIQLLQHYVIAGGTATEII